MKYEIKAEPFEGFGFDAKTSKLSEASGTKIQFRPHGKRGRWESFIVVGPLAGTLPEIVEGFVAEQAKSKPPTPIKKTVRHIGRPRRNREALK